jgi:hypothetical protein
MTCTLLYADHIQLIPYRCVILGLSNDCTAQNVSITCCTVRFGSNCKGPCLVPRNLSSRICVARFSMQVIFQAHRKAVQWFGLPCYNNKRVKNAGVTFRQRIALPLRLHGGSHVIRIPTAPAPFVLGLGKVNAGLLQAVIRFFKRSG